MAWAKKAVLLFKGPAMVLSLATSRTMMLAEKKLFELGYPEDKIAKVKMCILTHRGSQNMKKESVEAQIIAGGRPWLCPRGIPG
ncbi:MAG: hypothetical protein HGA74_15130 [Deltaproteobacteria bacterium]|nr:hypothetical protein [Deltaproteobacteria bacterium]